MIKHIHIHVHDGDVVSGGFSPFMSSSKLKDFYGSHNMKHKSYDFDKEGKMHHFTSPKGVGAPLGKVHGLLVSHGFKRMKSLGMANDKYRMYHKELGNPQKGGPYESVEISHNGKRAHDVVHRQLTRTPHVEVHTLAPGSGFMKTLKDHPEDA